MRCIEVTESDPKCQQRSRKMISRSDGCTLEDVLAKRSNCGTFREAA